MLDVFSAGVMSLWLEMAGVNSTELNTATQQVWDGGLSKLILLDQRTPLQKQPYNNTLTD
jgi:D-alanyl-D-alanine carboxypeptidase/D-alanyl-D-alanine-endopeptidase (penicillin-binding protein 4)